MWRLIVNVYEATRGPNVPVVRHTFFGESQEEAVAYFKTHLIADGYLRGCVEKAAHQSETCWVQWAWESDPPPVAYWATPWWGQRNYGWPGEHWGNGRRGYRWHHGHGGLYGQSGPWGNGGHHGEGPPSPPPDLAGMRARTGQDILVYPGQWGDRQMVRQEFWARHRRRIDMSRRRYR